MINPKFQNLTPEKALSLIRHFEKEIDQLLSENKITEWKAWESYFGLMYECNLWGFWEDRERILAKIDREKFNPFLSKNPKIVIIARDIIARHGLKTKLDN